MSEPSHVPSLSLRDIRRSFPQPTGALEVLKGCEAAIMPGELVAMVGTSGSGKSTLLQICGLLDNPTSGEIDIAGQPVARLGDRERTRLRRGTIGFIYQFHHLLPEFTALENVVLPQAVAGVSASDAKARARVLLERVNLGHRLNHRPAKLSGGEKQRVAIARAIANRPKLLLADEPTGNLDPETAGGVFDLFVELTREEGLCVLMATHNEQLAAKMDRVLHLEGGVLLEKGNP
ncbi:MAG: ABC transporter ATP-binding protein [Alphaproteobacteria bacterium]